MKNLTEFKLSEAAMAPLAVSPTDAARLVGIGRTTLFAALKSGDLRSSKVGKRRVVTIEALKEWLSDCETNSDQENGH